MSILNLIRPELINSPSYIPGGDNFSCKLNANELPWSPLIIDEFELNLYPNRVLQNKVQAQLAERYQVHPDQLVMTRGSDDAIDLLTRLFLTPGKDAFMQFPPTFSMFAFYVRLQQGELLQCPLDENNDFSMTLDAIKNTWKPHCKIIMMCSPNNPTGNLIDLNLIESVCTLYAGQSVVVVDEAYIEFANAKSAISLLDRFENLVILRTLSKAYGMAALRIGCVIGQVAVINALKKIMAPYPISNLIFDTAYRALQNSNWFEDAITKILLQRELLITQLQQSPIIEKVYASEANFVLIKTSYAKELDAWLAQQGIAIRGFPTSTVLQNHLRITVGDEEQNQQLIESISTFTQSFSGIS